MYFSKSKYCGFCKCSKLAWLDKYKPEVQTVDESAEDRMAEGNELGDKAKGFFGDYVETTVKVDGKLDLSAMIEKTAQEIEKGTENICEAAFSYNGFYCAVDILHKENDGYVIYEVKGVKTPNFEKEHEYFLQDVAYQKYVLEHCGIKVTGSYIVHLNGDYVRHGEIDIEKLFTSENVSDLIKPYFDKVEENLKEAEKILAEKNEPASHLSPKCKSPHDCPFFEYCTKDLPKDNVFTLRGFRGKYECYDNGIISFDDIIAAGEKLNKIQRIQIEYSKKGDDEVYVDKIGVKSFLDTLSYPLYFLDFETMQSAIPQFDGTTPYQQIPFEYSLHYVESEDAPVQHKIFLAESGKNPLRDIAESLCKDIPKNVCSIAYNKKFECDRLKELAAMFPDLSEHLNNIADHIIDLIIPFTSGFYYKKAMGGSFSIKSVLPAIFPDDPELDYNNLEGVHNGSEAKELFPRIKDMPKEEASKAYENLSKYCSLDTKAMVRIWQKLVRVTK